MTMPFFVVYLNRVRGIDLTVAGLALWSEPVASIAITGSPHAVGATLRAP
jgi:hypothetical protein